MNNNKKKCPRSTHRKNISVKKSAKKIATRKRTDKNTTNKNSIISVMNAKNNYIEKNIIIGNTQKKNAPNGENEINEPRRVKFITSCVFPFLGYYAYE